MRTLVLALLWVSTLPALAQRVPPPPAKIPADPAPAYTAYMSSAKQALESKKSSVARTRLLLALQHHPYSPEALELLLRACADDADARILWSHAYAAAIASDRGDLKPSRTARAAMSRDSHVQKIASSRASAAKQLAAFAAGQRGQPSRRLTALWAATLASELMRHSPALLERHAKPMNDLVALAIPDTKPIIDGLSQLMSEAEKAGEDGKAIEIARVIRGLAAQAGFPNLEGPKPPDMKSAGAAAGALIRRLRAKISKEVTPYELAKLESLSAKEKEAFNRKHGTPANPAVCDSVPEGLYRVETICGVDTLIGAVKTVELHHKRLVGWYGKDPFVGRKGVLRIVPEGFDMEAEGTPFFWAAGFQAGDRTTVRFAISNIESLGHTITHELTHRFDGAVFPLLPAWLMEGRATWTGGSYNHSSNKKFATGYANVGTLEAAFIKGYARRRNLERLISGTIGDYRDNYTAGYALWVYITTWHPGGKKLFADRVLPYLQSFKKSGAGTEPAVKRFERFFADGAGGRPAGFPAFATEWGKFLQGCYWRNRADWTRRFRVSRGRGGGGSQTILDHDTWVWSRTLAAPVFGQAQAAIAGRLLLAGGKPKLAAAAWRWALEVDEWPRSLAVSLAKLLDETGDVDGAWVVRMLMAHRYPNLSTDSPGKPPFEGKIAASFALLGDYMKAVGGYMQAGQKRAAAAIQAEQMRLLRLLGYPSMSLPEPSLESLTKPQPLRHTFNPPERHVGVHGWIETGLTKYEDRRVRNMWYVAPEGDVHVGRKKPRDGSGTTDRNAAWLDAFVRTREWLAPGRYLLRTRIHPTTSYVDGAIVIGYARRDRNIRLSFSIGDWSYAVGTKKTKRQVKSVRVALRGLRIRDGGLRGSTAGRTVTFENPIESFRVALLIERTHVVVTVEDQPVGAYHVADGQPIEGFLGFASSMGAYRVQMPTLLRLDRHSRMGLDKPWPDGLDPKRPQVAKLSSLKNLATRNIPTGPAGTLVYWMAKADETAAIAAAAALRTQLKKNGYTQRLVIALPAGLTEEQLATLRDKTGVDVIAHDWKATTFSALLFVDPFGALRLVGAFDPRYGNLDRTFGRWCRIFHDQKVVGKPRSGSTETVKEEDG